MPIRQEPKATVKMDIYVHVYDHISPPQTPPKTTVIPSAKLKWPTLTDHRHLYDICMIYSFFYAYIPGK